MGSTKYFQALSIGAAFIGGFAASQWLTVARAADAPTPPVMVNVETIRRSDMVVRVPGAAAEKVVGMSDAVLLKVQTGAPGKHYHPDSDEVQYVLEGTGTAWFMDRQVQVKPGDLLFIPRGVHHGAFSDGVKVLSVQAPPVQPGTTVNLR